MNQFVHKPNSNAIEVTKTFETGNCQERNVKLSRNSFAITMAVADLTAVMTGVTQR